MNVKKWFLAGLAGFVVMFILSGLWYMLIMGGFYQEQVGAIMREQCKTGPNPGNKFHTLIGDRKEHLLSVVKIVACLL